MKGNIGAWSEIYVFLKLLADGKLNAADANLNAVPDVYYPIIKILRQETTNLREFVIDRNINIYDGNTNELVLSLPIADFIVKSKELFENLKCASGRSMSFPEIESFLNSIDVNSLSAISTQKADISIKVHDLCTGQKPTLGFSIKSMIGKDSTLFNASSGTNFIFKITKPSGLEFDLATFNRETFALTLNTKKSKISLRITELVRLGFEIKFHKIQSQNLQLNLMLIDSQLPDILANLVLLKYKKEKSSIKELLTAIKMENPLGYDSSKGHPFYEYKIKNFLVENALGMTPEAVWTGLYNATGGMIIVKENGDIVCYHIYNRNEFQDYLINNTRIEQPATSEDENNPGFPKSDNTLPKPKPYKYGWVYHENGDMFIKLNLQIRFK